MEHGCLELPAALLRNERRAESSQKESWMVGDRTVSRLTSIAPSDLEHELLVEPVQRVWIAWEDILSCRSNQQSFLRAVSNSTTVSRGQIPRALSNLSFRWTLYAWYSEKSTPAYWHQSFMSLVHWLWGAPDLWTTGSEGYYWRDPSYQGSQAWQFCYSLYCGRHKLMVWMHEPAHIDSLNYMQVLSKFFGPAHSSSQTGRCWVLVRWTGIAQITRTLFGTEDHDTTGLVQEALIREWKREESTHFFLRANTIQNGSIMDRSNCFNTGIPEHSSTTTSNCDCNNHTTIERSNRARAKYSTTFPDFMFRSVRSMEEPPRK